jgi:hypothetical protein
VPPRWEPATSEETSVLLRCSLLLCDDRK